MKFPTVTVTLVSAALIYVVWDQTRSQPEPAGPAQFANVAASPVERGEVVDWVVEQIPAFCQEATGQGDDSEAVAQCVERSEKRSSACRRAMYDRFPDSIASDSLFRDLTLTMMECLVPPSEYAFTPAD